MSNKEFNESIEYIMSTVYHGVKLTTQQYETLKHELIFKLSYWDAKVSC